ncbi:hypothetical protein M0804_004487 [Polistes exclamans]|nr:hypothetical protein M0804_004487 [Polistes exclamans]
MKSIFGIACFTSSSWEEKTNKAAKNICSVLGQDAVLASENGSVGFKKFREGNVSLKDESGRDRVSNFDQEALQAHLFKNS